MNDFSSIRGGSFEAALRTKMGVGEDFQVFVEPRGGGQYQLSEYTWDTEAYAFAVIAQPMRWVETRNGTAVLMGDVSRHSERQEIAFDTIPDIWDWLTQEG